jgi:phage I-like protein
MKKNLLATAVALCALAATATEEDAVAALNSLQPKLTGFDDLAKALGLAAYAKPEAVIAACTARVDDVKKMREALGIAADVPSGDSLVAACTHIKNKGTTDGASADPDPSKFVAVSVVESLKKDLAVLTTKQRDGEVAELVESGLADGRLLAAQKDWATDLGKKDLASLSAYLKDAQPIAALRGTQTRGAPPEVKNAHGLTVDELAVCSQTGITPENFAAAKVA